jgi:transmembrane sensor
MMNKSDRIGTLLFRYVRKELTQDEERELTAWRYASPENESLFQEKTDRENILSDLAEYLDAKDRIFQKVKSSYPGPWRKPIVDRRLRRFQILGITLFLMVVLSAGLYFILNSRKTDDGTQPGRYQAVLVSLDGIPRFLDDFHRGFLLGSEGIRIEKMGNGELLYIVPNDTHAPKDKYIMLYTLRGGLFSLMLPDGTRVWLNAQSSIKYPANFSQDSILITVGGETYMEIAQRAKPLLRINAGLMWIESPGGQLNILSYPEEPTTLTQIAGSATVRQTPGRDAEPAGVFLRPSDQAKLVKQQMGVNLKSVSVPPGYIQEILAWKNGQIFFHDANVQAVMHTLSRWYDADIFYKGDLADQKYNLHLPNSTSLLLVLSKLERQGGHFTTQGKTITVSK